MNHQMAYVAISEVLRIIGDVCEEGASDFRDTDKEMYNLVQRIADAAFDAHEYCKLKANVKGGKA